jgi:hypothetical protein
MTGQAASSSRQASLPQAAAVRAVMQATQRQTTAGQGLAYVCLQVSVAGHGRNV